MHKKKSVILPARPYYVQNSFLHSRWCVIICKIVLLEFAHRVNYKIIKLRFGSCILLPSSGRKGGEETFRSEASSSRGPNR
jgi:hypothetical protein